MVCGRILNHDFQQVMPLRWLNVRIALALGVALGELTKEAVMGRYRLLPGLALIAISPAWSAVPLEAITAKSPTYHGGYQILSEFTVDSEKHAVISPPAGTSAGDLLWIRPRLNADEYLVLQKCKSADCSDAQVVRAWNAAGAMGPYVIVSNKARIEAGAKYMIWMQRISVKGGDIFPFYLKNSPPLIFCAGRPCQNFRCRRSKRRARIRSIANYPVGQ
jgi:hypothetical protein